VKILTAIIKHFKLDHARSTPAKTEKARSSLSKAGASGISTLEVNRLSRRFDH